MIAAPVLFYSSRWHDGHNKPRAGWITGEGGPGRWNLTVFGRPEFPDDLAIQVQGVPLYDNKPPPTGRPYEYAVGVKPPPQESARTITKPVATKAVASVG